jgi:hypothetical protein
MSRYVRYATKQKISIKIFMAILCLGASISGSLILSHPANALSLPLVNDVTNLLKQVLPGSSDQGPVTAAPLVTPVINTPAVQYTQSAPARVQTQSPSASPSQSVQSPPAASTTPVSTSPIATTLVPLNTDWQGGSKNGISKLASTHTSNASTLGTNSFAILQPSNQGWRVLGIVWYWWLLAAVIAFFIVRYRKYIKRLRLFKKPLVS